MTLNHSVCVIYVSAFPSFLPICSVHSNTLFISDLSSSLFTFSYTESAINLCRRRKFRDKMGENWAFVIYLWSIEKSITTSCRWRCHHTWTPHVPKWIPARDRGPTFLPWPLTAPIPARRESLKNVSLLLVLFHPLVFRARQREMKKESNGSFVAMLTRLFPFYGRCWGGFTPPVFEPIFNLPSRPQTADSGFFVHVFFQWKD